MNINNVAYREVASRDRARGYFTLPAFSYEFAASGPHAGSVDYTVDDSTITVDINDTRGSPFLWNGASQRVTQWNYTSTNNFVLVNVPKAPTGCNFCLCIAYRVGDDVFRYKLWQGVGEVLNAPLYANNIIKKNFTLEVWTTELTEAVDLESALLLSSSILAVYSGEDTFEVAAGTEAANQLYTTPTLTLDTTELIGWYRGDLDYLTIDAAMFIQMCNLFQGTGPALVPSNNPRLDSTDTVLPGHTFMKADGGILYSDTATEPGRQWVVLLKIPDTVAADANILSTPGLDISLVANSVVVTVGGVASTTFARNSNWMFFVISNGYDSDNTLITFTITDIEGQAIHSDFVNVHGDVPYYAAVTSIKNCNFAELLTFTEVIDVGNYVKSIQAYYGLFIFGSTLDANTVLVDNP